MIHRFIHQQTGEQDLLVDDIEDGTSNDDFARFHKKEVYIPYNRRYFDSNGNFQEDTSLPGFLDLPEDDDVLLSLDNGTLAGFKDQGFVNEVTYNQGDTDAPTISSAEHDDTSSQTNAFEADFTISDGSSGATGDYTITLNGTSHTVTDSNGSSDTSSTLASDLATAINNGSESSVLTASASGSTVNVTSDVLETSFTHSASTTDSGGSISTSITDTGKVVILGDRFNSIAPFSTTVTLEDPDTSTTNEFTESDISGNADSKLENGVIVIGSSLHGMGNTLSDVDDVTVQANDQTDSSSVSSL